MGTVSLAFEKIQTCKTPFCLMMIRWGKEHVKASVFCSDIGKNR
nr:MAG TPA: hypothetical protein [Bacteriophage sp.]DAR85619.1 MAG TPA: hypothetical protein [Caudoviricetes sp.]